MISEEENLLIEKLKKQDKTLFHNLDEREKGITETLIQKNIVNITDGKVIYRKLEALENILW